MKRRTFLQASAAGLGLASLDGCANAIGFAEGSRLDLHGVDDAHLVFDGDSPEFLIHPTGHQIFSVDDSGTVGRPFGGLGGESGELNYPIAGAIDDKGRLYVLDHGNERIVVFDADGKHLSSFGSPGRGRGGMTSPTDLALDGKGNLFVTDTGSDRIQVFGTDGSFKRSIEGDLNSPRGITIDSAGAIHVVDAGNARVVVFSPDGKRIGQYGSHGTEPGEFLLPRAIASDGEGKIFVGDPSSGFVSVFDESGNFVERSLPRHEDGSPAAPLELSRAPGGQPYVWTDGHRSHHAAGS